MSGDADPASVDPGRYDEDYFLRSCGGSEFFRLYGPRILKPAMAYAWSRAGVAKGMRVLDVGCGRGEILYHVRKAGAAGVGTDFAEAAMKIAARASECPVLRCDAGALPFADRSFDRVFLLGVMDHLRDRELEACFRELARVLKPGGRVLIHTCCNRLYYKNWSYGLRRLAARILRAAGLAVREPSPPRSGEDLEVHVNEHSAGSLRRFFRRVGWNAEVEPRANYKLFLRDLYGDPLPEGFPMRPIEGWRQRLYLALLWRGPMKEILAREFFCEARPAAEASAAP